MSATLSSHILDTHLGKPASGITVTLKQVAKDDSTNTKTNEFLAEAITNNDGRITVDSWSSNLELNDPQTNSTEHNSDLTLSTGEYSLTFATAEYFESQNIKVFYPEVVINFIISDSSHYHIPLLISAHGYSTYRGS